MKICGNCNLEKPFSEFSRRVKSKSGYQSYCRECCRTRVRNKEQERAYQREKYRLNPDLDKSKALKSKFGITLEEYNLMLLKQNGVCAICMNPEITKGRGDGIRRLAVDHDHATGRVLSLLCFNCNKGLGAFKESARLMLSAVQYLQNHSKNVK